MSASNLGFSFALAAAVGLGAASSGCYVVTSPGGAAPTQQASLDTDATMTVKGGAGAGAFVQYGSGGHWDVYTSCDYDTNGVPCSFNVVLSTVDRTATLSSPEGQALGSGDRAVLDADGTISLITTTTTGLDGVTFDADPGATVQFDMTLNGVDAPDLVDWVSAGKAVLGASTNPVDFIPTEP
jgi:hypothetical protein